MRRLKMKCPHCGNETDSYRMAIMDLADGTKTIHEAAELLDRNVTALRGMISNMRKEGYELIFKEHEFHDKNSLLNREEHILKMYMSGLSLNKIGEKLGISGSRASQLKCRSVRRHRIAKDETFKKYQEYAKRDW